MDLHVAVSLNNTEEVERLLREGANPNARDSEGRTPLHIAGTVSNGEELVHMLVEAGADVDAKDDLEGSSALHVAVAAQNMEVAEALLECGADVNSRHRDGFTPLHKCVETKNPKMCELLLRSRADMSARGVKGETALHLAVRVTQGVGANYRDCPLAKILIEYGADVNARDASGATPLHIALTNSRYTDLLLAYGADINIESNIGTPFIHSMKYRSKIYDSLAMHILALIAADLPVSASNREVFKDPENEFDLDCREYLKKEAGGLQDKIPGTSFTYHNILTDDLDTLEAFARNEAILDALEPDNTKPKFPYYMRMLWSHMKRGVDRKDLMDCGSATLMSIFGDKLPYECVYRIAKQLTNQELSILYGEQLPCPPLPRQDDPPVQ